jgi:steroid delta-isomerase-like uncharacterized protein
MTASRASDANKTIVRRYLQEVWQKRNVEATEQFLAPDYRRHLSPTADPLTLEGQKQRLAGFHAAFPDIELILEDIFAEGDRVAFRSTIRGTHQGAFQGIAATGRSITVTLVDIVRVEGGKLAEHWGGPDLLDLLKQLGAV